MYLTVAENLEKIFISSDDEKEILALLINIFFTYITLSA